MIDLVLLLPAGAVLLGCAFTLIDQYLYDRDFRL